MQGQTNRRILEPKLQRRLRKDMTDAERTLWQGLRGRQLHGCKFRRQHPHHDFILDFVCLERKLVIEVDGGQHVNSQADARRDGLLQDDGFTILRFWNHDVLERSMDVLERIHRVLGDLAQHHPHPALALKEREQKATETHVQQDPDRQPR